MKHHLVIYVKARDLQELLNKLDEKGWAVIDVEPRSKFWFFYSITLSYTVVCEYIGDDEYIDITPLDDTDDAFIKNENYSGNQQS